MRRPLALVLALAVAVSSAATWSLHVHAYAGHDHPEHRHGPASHGHGHRHSAPAGADHDHHGTFDHDDHADRDDHGSPGAHDDGRASVRLEPCNPGQHAVSVTMGGTQPPQLQLHLAALPGPTIVAPPAPIRTALAITDVRVHGPPFDVRIPARAPPLTLHA